MIRCENPEPVLIYTPYSGIGRFAIYDEAVVDEADLGVNFFLDESSLGKPRSQCVTSLLLELNPEVEGAWYPNGQVRFSFRTCSNSRRLD